MNTAGGMATPVETTTASGSPTPSSAAEREAKLTARKRDRRAEKKVERDKWQEEMAEQDTKRMQLCKRVYHMSLVNNLPLQPCCMFPVCVDSRDGIFMPAEPVADLLMSDCPHSGHPKRGTYNEAMAKCQTTGLRLLANEIWGFQTGQIQEQPTHLDEQIKAAHAKYHAVVAALALLASAIHYEKGFGVVSEGVVPLASSVDAVEMAFFAHGTLLRTFVRGERFVCYYADQADAQRAVAKMDGRKWKSDTLRVRLLQDDGDVDLAAAPAPAPAK